MLEKLKISTWVFWVSLTVLISFLLTLICGFLKLDYLAAKLIWPILYGGYYVSPYVSVVLVLDFIFNKQADKTKLYVALILNVIFFFIAQEIFKEISHAITMML